MTRKPSVQATLALCLTVALSWSLRAQDAASQVRSLTGSHTRLVWSQDQANSDFRGYDDNDKLFGFDTDDGGGVRQICPNGNSGPSG